MGGCGIGRTSSLERESVLDALPPAALEPLVLPPATTFSKLNAAVAMLKSQIG